MSTSIINRLVVVSIRTNRISETVDFYQNVIGLSRVANHGHQPAFELERKLFFLVRNEQGAVVWAYPVTVEPTTPSPEFQYGEEVVCRLSRRRDSDALRARANGKQLSFGCNPNQMLALQSGNPH